MQERSLRMTIKVIQYGLGPIGCAASRYAIEHPQLEMVGGVDIDPAKIGNDMGEVIGLERTLGFPVTEKLAQTLARTQADAVIHTTNSYFDQFHSQILEILEAGLDVVSTSEELTYPWRDHPKQAEELDGAAQRAGKTVISTGVNPGFLMDSLPLNLTAICQKVEKIEVTRIINASLHRGPFQKKNWFRYDGSGLFRRDGCWPHGTRRFARVYGDGL